MRQGLAAVRRGGGAGGLAALSLALAACVAPAPRPAGSTEAPPLTGRLWVKVEASASAPAQSMGAAFELAGDERQGQLVLLSPLGTRLADARWSPGEVSLRTADGLQPYASLQDLAREALGEDVPLPALTHWLAGRPWPAAPAQATAIGFDQLGWSVDLSRWTDLAQVEARRAAPPVVLVRARVDR